MDMCNAEIELEADSYGWIDFYGVGDSYDNDGFVMNGSNSTQSDPFKVVSSVFQTLLTLNRAAGNSSRSNNTKSDGPLLPLANLSASKHKCSYILRAPPGHALRIGVESPPSKLDLRDDLFGEEFTFLKLFGSKSSVVETRGWVVTVKAEVRPGSAFRVNYQVMEPVF